MVNANLKEIVEGDASFTGVTVRSTGRFDATCPSNNFEKEPFAQFEVDEDSHRYRVICRTCNSPIEGSEAVMESVRQAANGK